MRTDGSRPGRLVGWLSPVVAVIPGGPQLEAGARLHAGVISGSYLSGLFLTFFGWGTALGAVGAVFAVAVHIASLADAIARRPFPQHSRWRSNAVSLFSVSILIYLPIFLIFSPWLTPAWSASRSTSSDRALQGFLLNRRIYEQRQPARDEWVWLSGRGGRSGSLGVVIATAGQEIQWLNNGLRVDGLELPRLRNFKPSPQIDSLQFKVPARHVLVATNLAEPTSPGGTDWMLVPTSGIEGRVHVQMYPVWERRLLL